MSNNLLKGSPIMQRAYDRFLVTLRNKTRLAIVQSLIEKPKNVNQITKELRVHQSSVSHALKRLLDCGFVFVKKDGKERVYSVNKKTISPLIKLMDSHVDKYCKGCCEKK